MIRLYESVGGRGDRRVWNAVAPVQIKSPASIG